MDINDLEHDEIITNLIVISKIEKNKKLITTEAYLNIEQETVIPEFIKRYIRGDNRDEAIKKIDLCTKKAIILLKTDPELKDYLQHTKKGLFNLMETYSKCNKTKARLETIISNIDRAIDEV